MLRSVIKHLGSGGGEHSRSEEKRSLAARISPYTPFVLSSLPKCFITEQSTVQAVLFVK